ncbi:MAG: M28 family peptidase [Myxococcota bacterium]
MMVWLALTAGASELGETLLAEATAIVEELGPRPARTAAGDAAQRWTQATLEAAGWTAERVLGPDGYVMGCQPGADARIVLFIAHTDTVHAAVPGANDNAAAMAVLLHLARDLPGAEQRPRTVCLAFPDSEEIGLRGSRRLAADVTGERAPLDQVMALDLVGRGQLTHNGLGPAWSTSQLRALLEVAPAEVPWVYRAISQGYPSMERSDHHWFGRMGIPSSHLMARAESGVLWPYHTADDEPSSLEPETLAAAYAAVHGVAYAPPLPRGSGGIAVVVPWTRMVVPGWGVLVAMAGLLVGTLAARFDAHRKTKEALALAPLGGLVLLAAMGAWIGFAVAGSRPFGLALAGYVATAGWAGLLVAVSRIEVKGALAATMVVALFLGLAGLAVWGGLPLLAPPVLSAALATALLDRVPRLVAWGLLPVALWPGLYFVRGDAIRELAHHQMVPPTVLLWTGFLLVLGSPLAVFASNQEAPVRRGLLGIGVVAFLWGTGAAWMTPVMQAPYERGPWYAGPNLPPYSPIYPHPPVAPVDPARRRR